MLEDLKSHVSAQHENRSIFDERLDLADLDMTSFRADEELGKDIIEPPAAQAGTLHPALQSPCHCCRTHHIYVPRCMYSLQGSSLILRVRKEIVVLQRIEIQTLIWAWGWGS